MSDTRSLVGELRDQLERLSEQLDHLEGQDKLGSAEINDLISQYNQSETLAASVAKKLECLRNGLIGNI